MFFTQHPRIADAVGFKDIFPHETFPIDYFEGEKFNGILSYGSLTGSDNTLMFEIKTFSNNVYTGHKTLFHYSDEKVFSIDGKEISEDDAINLIKNQIILKCQSQEIIL
jgi:hypothetical protein